MYHHVPGHPVADIWRVYVLRQERRAKLKQNLKAYLRKYNDIFAMSRRTDK